MRERFILIFLLLFLPGFMLFASRQGTIGVGVGLAFSSDLKGNIIPASPKFAVLGFNVKYFFLENVAIECIISGMPGFHAESINLYLYPINSLKDSYLYFGSGRIGGGPPSENPVDLFAGCGLGMDFYLGRQLWGWSKISVDLSYFRTFYTNEKKKDADPNTLSFNYGYVVFNEPE